MDLSYEIARDLVAVSTDFMMNNLREKCINYLCDHLTSANAVEIINIAESYELHSLRETALMFLSRNKHKISEQTDLIGLSKSALIQLLLKKD